MESKRNEASNLHSKRKKTRYSAQLPSCSVKDSIFNRIPVLPEEVVTQILLRLPVKSLLKFRFMLTISLPKYNLTDCSASSLLYDCAAEALDLEYPTKEIRRSVEVVGSVHGLICLVIAKKYFLIWNPSIRKFKKLPECRDEFCFGHHFLYGFGYDEVHGDYKVVAGFNNEGYSYSFLV
ncbi:F-box/kelch-repeat protein At3g23880-like [Solanum pennellii]|uniref:F-box/kelch-repeat protein At3g23880-like n=1 Tax=Solanum pennellii TaxID=28526 RepID=A0ABM1G0A1_SOLPN|nr:F-box/kelch-repeat protein At3g23880-like [Solanum pennellii]